MITSKLPFLIPLRVTSVYHLVTGGARGWKHISFPAGEEPEAQEASALASAGPEQSS